jgi:ABC-2 type transport system ATP-binding protein
MANAIETSDLTRRFGRLEAVNGLDLSVPAGAIFALIGPNGAGKTTTIKLLMNLVRASRGSAAVLGVDSRRLGPREFQRIGYVSENQHQSEWMSPGELLAYLRPLYPRWDEGLCATLLRELGLPSQSKLETLSRGMRMKAALVASLAYRPELLVLDEPFTGLDPYVREELVRTLLDRDRSGAWTVLVSSHDIAEVERLADWIGFLQGGRLAFAEPVASLLGRFRLVEIVSSDAAAPKPVTAPFWIHQGITGHTLRLIDTRHDAPDAAARLAAAYPGASMRISPLSLRDIFVALVRPAPFQPLPPAAVS